MVNIIAALNYFAVLSDGSQAWKTNSKKELILVCIVCDGLPMYLCHLLENMDDYGEANAMNIKKPLDDVFQTLNKIRLEKMTIIICWYQLQLMVLQPTCRLTMVYWPNWNAKNPTWYSCHCNYKKETLCLKLIPLFNIHSLNLKSWKIQLWHPQKI